MIRRPPRPPPFPHPAPFRSRYVGEPLALVVAEDRHAAEDAAERVSVDYEPLEAVVDPHDAVPDRVRSEEHTSELQSRLHLVCRLLLENKKQQRDSRDDRTRS